MGEHISEPEIFQMNNDIPHITPHPIDKHIPNFITQTIFAPADKNTIIVFAKKSSKIPERVKKDEEHIDISKKLFCKIIKYKVTHRGKGSFLII